jgi:glycerol kinase
MLLDLDRSDWSSEACALFEIEPEALPTVVDCASVVGETEVFGAPMPVSGLVVDQQAALFAESCFGIGEAKCTYGTGAFILATAGDDPVRSRSRLAACVAWRLNGITTYCLDGQVYTAASAVSWLEKLGLIGGAADLDGLGPERDRGALFVPALAGLAAPFWAPEARAGWIGLSLATDRDDLVRAVVWGIAAQIASLASAIGDDIGRPLDRLRVDGGLSRSAMLMQAQADLLQAPVERYPSPDATALGAGALARLGIGDVSSPTEAVGSWVPAATFEPRMNADEAHERLARWNRGASALADLSRQEA